MRTMRAVTCCVGLLTMGASVAIASPITIPSGLAPGSTYYLAFVTDDTTDALSSVITTYDAFVTAEANLDPTLAALGASWKVIGSTHTVSAFSHTAVTGPVYRLDGVEIASGVIDLWDGSIDAHLNTDQHGSFREVNVWTGTSFGGTIVPFSDLGDAAVIYGDSSMQDSRWMEASTSGFPSGHRSVYGISGPLVVPQAAVPEPGTISLMLGPALVLLGRYRRRRARLATPPTRSGPASH